MYLLKFSVEEKNYFLYNAPSNSFVGARTFEEAERACAMHTAKAISVGGFELFPLRDYDHLLELIGGTPFRVIDIGGGFGIPFCGVEIKELSEES